MTVWETAKQWAATTLEALAAWTTVICVWLAETVLALGYPGITLLMAVESSFLPFPSELVMPPAGFLIHEGQMSWLPVIAAGTLGSLAGALANYYLALRLGRPFLLRYGKYFFLDEENLEKTERFFAAHGEITTFIGRLIPIIRQLISLPAGVCRMNPLKFCLYTSIGAGLWVTVLTVVGWLVGRNQELLHYYMRHATFWVLAVAAVAVAAYVKLHRRRRRRRE
ncbi:MAG: DedA family protein [Planctomycetes bacterium]|nr:DedA family protein [Planctomycetota bacterium]